MCQVSEKITVSTRDDESVEGKMNGGEGQQMNSEEWVVERTGCKKHEIVLYPVSTKHRIVRF